MFIGDLVDQLPVYVPLVYKNLAIDYSLIAPPKVSQGFLTAYSNGAIINLNKINLQNIKQIFNKYSDLPDFDVDGKSVQMFLSEDWIATSLNTLYETHLLEVTVLPEDVPKESPFQLNTSSMSILIQGMSDVYGKDKKVKVFVNVTEIPKFEVSKGLVNSTAVAEITIYVLTDSGEH